MADSENQEVPFDMAKETLKSIRLWIDKITQISLGTMGGSIIPMNDMIKTKSDMVRQLIVLASPMIENDIEEIEKFYTDIKFSRNDIKLQGGWVRNVIVYSQEADYKLDSCVIMIQKALKKYFVPTIKSGELY